MPVRAGLGAQTAKKHVLVLVFACSQCGFKKTVAVQNNEEACDVLNNPGVHCSSAAKRFCGFYDFVRAMVQFE